jgi:hypothetical protein
MARFVTCVWYQTYKRYDALTARELFRSAGVSRKLYEGFLAPMLLVTLFAPPENLSGRRAALYYELLWPIIRFLNPKAH